MSGLVLIEQTSFLGVICIISLLARSRGSSQGLLIIVHSENAEKLHAEKCRFSQSTNNDEPLL